MTEILEPDTIIRPIIDEEGAKVLVEKLYGITVLDITELNGYDDKNYRIEADNNINNAWITNFYEHGYVLKIMNSADSINLEVVEAQIEIINFLNTCSVPCSKPVRNIFGHLYCVKEISGKKHTVRLLEYIPGVLLKDVPKPPALLYQLGEFVSNLDQKLEKFNHSGLVYREHIWMLTMVPELQKFTYVIKDAERLSLVLEVIEEFKQVVVPRLGQLEKGVIHGDVNEMNVLVGVEPETKESDYRVTGIIDFGDTQYSYYVFELAIAMTYMILVTGDIRAGGYVFAGYTDTKPLPAGEYSLLKTLISARLVQSLTLGAYSINQNPNNIYVLSTEKANGWELLKKIFKSNSNEGSTDWKTIANEYNLTKS